jgi:hypothetical protein
MNQKNLRQVFEEDTQHSITYSGVLEINHGRIGTADVRVQKGQREYIQTFWTVNGSMCRIGTNVIITEFCDCEIVCEKVNPGKLLGWREKLDSQSV